jgi:hypothetical protein
MDPTEAAEAGVEGVELKVERRLTILEGAALKEGRCWEIAEETRVAVDQDLAIPVDRVHLTEVAVDCRQEAGNDSEGLGGLQKDYSGAA